MIAVGRLVAAFLLASFIGLSIGTPLRADGSAPLSRPEAAAALFEHWCIGLLRGENLVPGPPLTPIETSPNVFAWVDPASGFTLRTGDTFCNITDESAVMTQAERVAFAQITSESMANWAPALESNLDIDDADRRTLLWQTDDEINPFHYQSINLTVRKGDGPDVINWIELILVPPKS